MNFGVVLRQCTALVLFRGEGVCPMGELGQNRYKYRRKNVFISDGTSNGGTSGYEQKALIF
jgi:hypothetical protein